MSSGRHISDDALKDVNWQEVARDIWMAETERRLKGPGVSALVSVQLTQEQLAAFLQVLRTWDVENGCDSAIVVLGAPVELVDQAFNQLRPPLPLRVRLED